MNTYVLTDRYFDPEAGRISSYFCQLFVLIGHNTVQYAINETEKNSFFGLAAYHLPVIPKNDEMLFLHLDQLLAEEELLQKKYSSVVVGIDSPYCTLVPSPLFDPEHLRKILEMNFSVPGEYLPGSEKIEEIDARNIYAFHPLLGEAVRKHFGEVTMVHRSTPLMKAVYRHYQAGRESNPVFLHFRDRYFDLVYFRENRLAFYNSFPHKTKEDVLYFTLFTLEQLGLRPDSMHLVISGQADTDDETCSLLKQYIHSVSFTGFLNAFNYSPLLKQATVHYYQELFALALCGS